MKDWPKRLHHEIPSWVADGSTFHIRIRLAKDSTARLTSPKIAPKLLQSVEHYETEQIWYPHLFLLMPDHLHALLSFAPNKRMSRVIGDWKRFNRLHCGISWQSNYFDHRIRNDQEFELKAAYIRNNPVRGGLCKKPEEWKWVIPPVPG